MKGLAKRNILWNVAARNASARSVAAEVSLRDVWRADDERRRTLREALMVLPLVAVLGVVASGASALQPGQGAPLALAPVAPSIPAGLGFDAGLPSASAILAARTATPEMGQDVRGPTSVVPDGLVDPAAGTGAQVAPLRPQTPPPLMDMVELPTDEPEALDAASARAAAERSADRATDARARVER